MRTKLVLVGIVFLIIIVSVLYFLTTRTSPPKVVYSISKQFPKRLQSSKFSGYKPESMPSFDEFMADYLPKIADASPEVKAVMKQFDPLYRTSSRHNEIEEFLPTDEWIQKLLDMGIAIEDFTDYSGWLSVRYGLLHAQKDSELLSLTKQRLNLSEDADWDTVVDEEIRVRDRLFALTDEAMANDPLVSGGSLDSNGVFLPNRLNTVYVQTEGTASTITMGSGVPEWLPKELAHRHAGDSPDREIPEHIEIIFLNNDGEQVPEEVSRSRATAYQLESYLLEDDDVKEVEDFSSLETIATDNTSRGEPETNAKSTKPDVNLQYFKPSMPLIESIESTKPSIERPEFQPPSEFEPPSELETTQIPDVEEPAKLKKEIEDEIER